MKLIDRLTTQYAFVHPDGRYEQFTARQLVRHMAAQGFAGFDRHPLKPGNWRTTRDAEDALGRYDLLRRYIRHYSCCPVEAR